MVILSVLSHDRDKNRIYIIFVPQIIITNTKHHIGKYDSPENKFLVSNMADGVRIIIPEN